MDAGGKITRKVRTADSSMDREKETLLNHILLDELLNCLGDSERNLIKMRYFENMTQVQVARILGMSQVQVSRTEKKILLGMREKLR